MGGRQQSSSHTDVKLQSESSVMKEMEMEQGMRFNPEGFVSPQEVICKMRSGK